jgi:uracil-DNA glycosylase
MKIDLPPCWRKALAPTLASPEFAALAAFVDEERRAFAVYPAEDDVWNAFRLTPLARVRVVLLGQDPYPGEGQAHGLCFSVLQGQKPPPSLANIFREAAEDVPGFAIPAHGDLSAWARQGVLLLNTILTVRAGEAGSHRGKGWEMVTDAVVSTLAARRTPVVFALWGLHAQKKERLLEGTPHPIVRAAHPSPLSARQGFFGARPFSAINEALIAAGQTPIEWRLA